MTDPEPRKLTDADDALDALRTQAPRPRASRMAILATGVAIVALAIAGLQLLSIASGNREAIKTGCILLSNAIVQSGGTQASGPGGETPPQARLNALYITGPIRRSMTPSERRQERELQQEIAQSGGAGPVLPDCDRIVEHPDTVTTLAPPPPPDTSTTSTTPPPAPPAAP